MKTNFRVTAGIPGILRARATKIAVVVAAVAATFALPARADLIFSGTGTSFANDPTAAKVSFSLNGNKFEIVLTNTAPAKVQADVLTNLLVTTAPSPATALPGASGTAALTQGSTLVSGTLPLDTHTIGQEWAYFSGTGGGVASSGFGVGTGNGNLCGGGTNTVLCQNNNAQQLDGSAYGLVGPNTKFIGHGNFVTNTYIESSITIDIILASNSDFKLSDITHVQFQYGTGTDDASYISFDLRDCTGGSDCTSHDTTKPAPEPASMALFGTSLLGFGLIRRRKHQPAEQLPA